MMRDSRRRSPDSSKRRKRDKRETRDERGSREQLAQIPPAPMSSSSYQDLLRQQPQSARAGGPSSDTVRTRGDLGSRTSRHQRPRAPSSSASSSGASTSPSLLDISRHYPARTRFGGIFGTFFRTPSERRVRRRRSGRAKKSGTRGLYFGNSSSSSVNSDLAYGQGYIPRRRSRDLNDRSASQGNGRRSRDQQISSGHGGAAAAAAVGASRSRPDGPQRAKTDEEILEIGRQLSGMAKRQNEHDLRATGKIKPSGLLAAAAAVNEVRRKRRHDSKSRGIGSSKPHGDYSSDGSDWEDADEDDGYSDGAESALAYGSVVSHMPRTSKASSMGATAGAAAVGAGLASMAGREPSGSFPVSDSRKSSVVDPRLFGPQNSLRGMINTPCGFGDDKQAAEEHLRFNKLRRADTEPILGGTRRDDAELPYRSRPAAIPLQQPSPKAPVSSKVYQAEKLEEEGLREAKASKRRSDQVGGSSALKLSGVAAAAAAAAALASGRRQKREERRRERHDGAEGSGKRDRESEADKERRRSKRDSYSSKYPDNKEDHKRSPRHVDDETPRKRRETAVDDRPGTEAGSSKSSRRDIRKIDDRDERRDRGLPSQDKAGYDKTRDNGDSSFVAGKAPVDPFQFQVTDGVLGASLGAAAAGGVPGRPLTPTVVTVDREPNFDDLSSYELSSPISRLSRKDSFELEREAESYRSGEASSSKKTSGARQSHDYEEHEHEARNIYEEARHSTAPIASAAMASAVAVEMGRSRERHRKDYSEDGSRDASRSDRDPVQEEADRYYREVMIAQRIATEEQHSRSQSPERSVVHKYDEDEGRDKGDKYQIVTPPELDEKKDAESLFAGPDADVRIDNKIFPAELHRFRAPESSTGKFKVFNSRDPSCERERPVLNLVYPTPIPSRQATPVPQQEAAREVATESKPTSTSKSKDKKKKKKKVDETEQEISREVSQPTESTVPSSKSVTWGENSTKRFEVVSPEPSREVDDPRPRISAGSQWGILAAAIAGSSTEPANEPETSKSSSSKRSDPVSSSTRGVSVGDDVHGERPPIPGPKPASSTTNKMPGGFADDIEFAATLAAGLKDTGFDPNIVIDDPNYRRRDSPPHSSESNGDGWSSKSFSDAVMDITAKQKPTSTTGEDEIRDGPSTAVEDEWAEIPKKLSKKEKKKLEKAARRQSVEVEAEAEGAPPADTPEAADETPVDSQLSKKELRKLEKQAKKDAERVSDDKDLPRDAVDDAWEETTKKKSKKNRKSRDLEDDSSSKVSVPTDAFDDLKQLRRDDTVDDEWETSSKKSKKKSKRDSTGSEVLSRSVAVSEEADADSGSRRSSKSKRRSGADFDDYGDDPPDRGRDPFDDRDVTSVVSESRGDDRHKERRSKRSSGYDDDNDDAKSVASMPASSSKSKDADRKEKRSSGIFSGLFKSNSKEESRDLVSQEVSGKEKEKDSFLDNAGTLGAGVGIATAAAAFAASVSRSEAEQLNKSVEAAEPDEPNMAKDYDDVDPEIAPRAIKPAIDPQYGDLLPLPPSEPGSPTFGPEEDLPALPDSRPDTPPEERNLKRGQISHRRRRSLQEPPIKSPSRTAIPISLRLGARGGTPTSPGSYRSPPSSSPIGTPESVSRRQVRHTSWDSSREIKPLYLLEHSRQNSADTVPFQSVLPALPASETSSSESQLSGHGGEDITDRGIEAHDLASTGLHINTGLASAAAADDFGGSQETTPRAVSQPQFPSLSEVISPSVDIASPDPVDSMSKDRSSYLLNSTPSSTISNKTIPSEGGILSPVDSTPSKKLGVESSLPDIAEDLASADEHYASAIEGGSEDRWEEAEDWGGSSKNLDDEMHATDQPTEETLTAAPTEEEAEPEEWRFMTAKEKKKAKKARKSKELALTEAAGAAAATAAVTAPAFTEDPIAVDNADDKATVPVEEFEVSKKGKKAKKGKKKSLSLAWGEDLGDAPPTESSTDKDATTASSNLSETVLREVVDVPVNDEGPGYSKTDATADSREAVVEDEAWELPSKKSKKKNKSKSVFSWDAEDPKPDNSYLNVTEDAPTETKVDENDIAAMEAKGPVEPAADDMWSIPLSKKDKKKKKKKGMNIQLDDSLPEENPSEPSAESKDIAADAEKPSPFDTPNTAEDLADAYQDDTVVTEEFSSDPPKPQPVEEFAVVPKGKKGKKSKRKSVQFDESSLVSYDNREYKTDDNTATDGARSLETQISEPLFSQGDGPLETSQDTNLAEDMSQAGESFNTGEITWDETATSNKSMGNKENSSNVWDLLEEEPSIPAESFSTREESSATQGPLPTEYPVSEDEWSKAVSHTGSKRKSSLSAWPDSLQEGSQDAANETEPTPEILVSTSHHVSLDAPPQDGVATQSEDEWASAVSSKKSKRKQRDSLAEAFPEVQDQHITAPSDAKDESPQHQEPFVMDTATVDPGAEFEVPKKSEKDKKRDKKKGSNVWDALEESPAAMSSEAPVETAADTPNEPMIDEAGDATLSKHSEGTDADSVPVESRRQEAGDNILSKNSAAEKVASASQDIAAETDDWALPVTLSKKDKKKKKKQAALDQILGETAEPSLTTSPADETSMEKIEAEPAVVEPIPEMAETAAHEVTKSLDADPEDTWGGFSVKKSKKAKKGKKNKDVESQSPLESLPTSHADVTFADRLEDDGQTKESTFPEDAKPAEIENQIAQEDAAEKADDNDDWAIGLSKKEKKKRQKARALELSAPLDSPLDDESEPKMAAAEAGDDPWAESISEKDKKRGKTAVSEFDDLPQPADIDSELKEDETSKDYSPDEALEPLEQQPSAPAADEAPAEDEWLMPTSGKKSKKAKKARKLALDISPEDGSMEPPRDLPEADHSSYIVEDAFQPAEATESTEPAEPIEDKPVASDPLDATPADTWEVPQRKLSKKEKKKQKSQPSTFDFDEPTAESASVEAMDAANTPATADSFTAEPDEWQPSKTKKEEKKAAKLALAAAAAATTTLATSPEDAPPAEAEATEVPQKTAPVDELPRFGGGGSWADEMDELDPIVTPEPKGIAEPNLTEPEPQLETPAMVVEDEWALPSKKKGKKGKKSKTSSGVQTPIAEPEVSAERVLGEPVAATGVTDEQTPTEPRRDPQEVGESMGSMPTEPTEPTEVPEKIEGDDDWGFAFTKKGKKSKKSKSGGGVVTPAAESEILVDEAFDVATTPTATADEQPLAEASADTRDVVESTEGPLAQEAPMPAEAEEDWGFTIKKKSKKGKKSKAGSGVMTPTAEPEASTDQVLTKSTPDTPGEPISHIPGVTESVEPAPAEPDAPKQVDGDDEWDFTVKKKKKDKKRKSSLATPVDTPPRMEEPLQTEEQQSRGGDEFARDTSEPLESTSNVDRSDPSTADELVSAGATAGGVAMLAEKFGGAGKKKKGKGKKRELDKREQREPDMFDDPALWEGAEKKGVEGGRDGDLNDDFWGGGGAGSDIGEGEPAAGDEPATLLRRGSKVEEPAGELLAEMTDAEPMTPVRDEFRQSPTRSLPAVAEVPEMENEAEAEAEASRANRDSGFATGSPPQRRRSITTHDEEQRDSGVHTGDWVDDDKTLAHSRSPFTGPTLREPDEAPATPEPEKKRKSKSKSKTAKGYGDVLGGLGGAAALAGVGSALGRSDVDDEHDGRRIASDSRGPYNRGGAPETASFSHSHGENETEQARSGGSDGPAAWPRADPVPRRVASNTSLSRRRTPEPLRVRPESPGSWASHRATPTPPLRRVAKRMSGDLRALRQQTSNSTLSQSQPVANESRVRSSKDTTTTTTKDGRGRGGHDDDDDDDNSNNNKTNDDDYMADVFDGYGEGRMGSPRSPTRPHSMRRRQSMQVLELESRVDQLLAENRMLSDARNQAEQNLSQRATGALSERDAEIESLKQSLHFLQNEVARLTEVNEGLTSANAELATRDGGHDANSNSGARGLGEAALAAGAGAAAGGLGTHASLSASLEEKDAEIADLRAQLDEAKEQVRQMQRQILESKAGDSEFLMLRDEDYFDHRCQQLCSHVQQWVLRFSKFSDMRACRLTSEINDEKTIDRLDNAVLDGSDVDVYLRDRVKRRDVFMSMTMNMIWEFVFTRYLFGMDREQRQKLKSLEKLLSEVGPAHAVRQWRAVTLTLLSRRDSFRDQRDLDTEAVVQAIIQTLCKILPPPSNLEGQIQSQLRRVMQEAVDLSIEMRTQRAEYMMLPPLQPEYDADGELTATVSFDAAMMNERGPGLSNEDLEAQGAVVRVVLFPLVVKRGDDQGVGEDKIVVCPAQVLVARDDDQHRRSSRHVTPMSDAGDVSMGGGPSRISLVTDAMSAQPEAQYIEGGI